MPRRHGPRGRFEASRHRSSVSGVVVVHFSPSRTSRPVGCRSTARALACRVASRRTRQIPGRPTGCSAVSISKGIRPHTSHSNCVGAAASVPWRLGRTSRRPKCLGSCWHAANSDGQRRALRGARSRYRSATLLLWVLSGPVLKHGPRSLTCARVIGTPNPKGAMKVKVGRRADRGRMGRVATRPRTPGASRSHREERRTQSVHVGTRKMVNYAWSGRSQGKP